MRLCLLAMAVLLLLGSCQQPANKQSTEEGAADGKTSKAAGVTTEAAATAVETAVVKLGDIQASSDATALFTGIRDVTLAAETGGTITKIAVEEGDRVKQGQLLLEIDHVQLDANVANTQAQLESARAQAAMAKSATRPQQLAQAEAAVAQAQAALDLAQKNYNRQLELFNQDVISKAVLDSAEAQLKQAQSGYDAAQQALSLAREGARAEDIQTAEAQVRALEAALAMAKDAQRKAYIKAPFGGRIAKVYPEEHEMASPGTPMLGLVDDSVMELTVGVGGSIVNRLKVGTTVDINVEAASKRITGKVTAIGVKGDEVSGVFPVKLSVDNPQAQVLSGMAGTVTLPLETKRGVLVLPRDVVLFSKEGASVMVVEPGADGGDIAHSRKITLGMDAGKYVEVATGLKAGEQLIVTGMKNVFDGDPVNVQAKRELELPQISAD